MDFPDWGPVDSNAISGNNRVLLQAVILYLSSGVIDTLKITTGAGFKWSPSGNYFIGHDEGGYFVIKRDGSNKWHLKP